MEILYDIHEYSNMLQLEIALSMYSEVIKMPNSTFGNVDFSKVCFDPDFSLKGIIK